MKKKFTDDQIIAILKEAQQGELSTEELCRKHGCSTASFYSWKKKFGDTSSDQAKLLRRLQRENGRLLRLVGQQQFELEAMKDVLAKKR